MKMKKWTTYIVMCAILVSCLAVVAFATEEIHSQAENDALGCLTIGDQGIRIYASETDIINYLNADNAAEKEILLTMMLADQGNKVTAKGKTYGNSFENENGCDAVGLAYTGNEHVQNWGAPDTEEWGVLNIVDQNIGIYAKVSDILTYVEATNTAEKEKALKNLLADEMNHVTTANNSLLMHVTDSGEKNVCNYVDVVATTRKPGKWTINSSYDLVAGGVVSYGPSDAAAFDVAYDETVHLSLKFAGTRYVSAECETSYPSIFYDPEEYTGGFQSWWSNLSSGQYRIYIKNYDEYDMTITGGYIEIYE